MKHMSLKYEKRLNASKTIQGFFRKYANFENMKEDLRKSSENWLKHNDPARVYGATMIQRSWRLYRKSLLVNYKVTLVKIL